MVKMQESLEGDKDCNIGKLQEILERAEIRHTLEDLGIYMCTYCTQSEFVALAPCMKKCRSQLGRGYSLLTPLFGPGVSAAAGTLEGFRLVRGAMGCDSRRVMVRMNREMRILG